MPPTLRCPECDARFTPSPDDAGRRRLPCPDCGAMVSARSRDLDNDDRPRRSRDVDDDTRYYGRRPARPRRSGGPRALLIGLGVVGIVVLGCCVGMGGLFWYAVSPTSFPEPTQDYADARRGFKTKLLVTGPAPQSFDDDAAPAGVKVVDYGPAGSKLKAWVEPPRPGGPLKPGVLFLHGGFAFGDDDWDQAKPFRDAGFVTLLPILRGENGQPGSFTMFYDEVDDVLAAADALAKTPGVDPKRLYVAGHSAGGTLTMLAAMTSSRFKAAASFSGSPDQKKFAEQGDFAAPFDQTDPREFAMRSPLAYYQSFKCPARLYYGNEEFAFKFSTKRLADRATAAGKDVKAVEIPGDHMTSVDPAMRQAITFFQSKQ